MSSLSVAGFRANLSAFGVMQFDAQVITLLSCLKRKRTKDDNVSRGCRTVEFFIRATSRERERERPLCITRATLLEFVLQIHLLRKVYSESKSLWVNTCETALTRSQNVTLTSKASCSTPKDPSFLLRHPTRIPGSFHLVSSSHPHPIPGVTDPAFCSWKDSYEV